MSEALHRSCATSSDEAWKGEHLIRAPERGPEAPCQIADRPRPRPRRRSPQSRSVPDHLTPRQRDIVSRIKAAGGKPMPWPMLGPTKNVVCVQIHFVRRHFPEIGRRIVTVYGEGYRWVQE